MERIGVIGMHTTVTLSDKLSRALKGRTAESDESISGLIAEGVKYQVLEDVRG
jgi:hypothetical protein